MTTQVLMIGTADWNQPIATNQHYVARELSRDRSAELVFLESLGLRQPEISRRDLRRLLVRAKRLILGRRDTTHTRPKPAGVTVVSSAVLPKHVGVAASFNRRLLRRQVRRWIELPGRKVLWTYSPVTYGLEEEADDAFYHCVDLLGKFPGIDEELIESNERRLARKGVRAIGSSPVVVSHLESMGFTGVLLWTNVADTETIAAADPVSATRNPRRAIFAGNLTANKVDLALLQRLARSGIDVRVAGPVAEGGGGDVDVDDLLAAGVTHLGMLSLPELATEMASASVGLIPYLSNEYTRGVSPLKTYEYLAAGLPVVSIGVPSVTPIAGHVTVVASHDEFIEAVSSFGRAAPGADLVTARAAIARDHSWSGRGVEARIVAGLSPRPEPATQRDLSS
ncbi:glycosyltransferase [Microbacterium sp. HD4P20]|uniref:glycosyltransferase n=1 Tax=Microbacterium sp. HD4P20 TaxID=2864874 RepID=UPI001C63DCC3|nr:glycosyltransferase [Microbacterium sp. HD4P20]MCP2638108.1 glycosyltransferase [Microbacterium sp. HD4P20]